MELDPSKGIPIVKEKLKMEGSLTIPSAVHGYSIAIEYMKNFFLEKFHEDYFKTIYVNGKHILDDYRRFSIFSNIKRERPMVAIVPTINMEYDRDKLDLYMGNKDMLIRSFNFRESFFADPEKNIYLGFNVREIEMNFVFKTRVETKAQQLDLYRFMELAFRIGYTQRESISVDFHIPNEMIINLASHAGFSLDTDGRVLDVNGFLAYVNKHSKFPVVYKLRAINGHCEFFCRVGGVNAWVSTQDKLQDDDGEMEGKLATNFHVEMSAVLRIWVPHFYVYFSKEKNIKYIPYQDSNHFGLFTFKIFDPPEMNSSHWLKYLTTDYELDQDEIGKATLELDIKPLFKPEVQELILDHVKKGISPSSFIDLWVYNFKENDNKIIDWENFKVTVSDPKVGVIHIVIYMDMLYYNSQMAGTKQIKDSRLN